MDNLPAVIPNGSPVTSWGNKVNKNIGQNKVVRSKDFILEKFSTGTRLKLTTLAKTEIDHWTYTSEWDADAGYSYNDVVRVMPSKVYHNSGSALTCSVSSGVYICVSPVPDKTTTDYVNNNGLSGSWFIRDSSVNYNPAWPEPSTVATPSNKTGAYWHLIGQLTGGAGGGVNYRGTYNSSTTYQPGDIVRVQSGTSQGIWIQAASGSCMGIDPVFPEPATTGGINTWDMFAFGVQARIDCSNTSTSSIEYWNGTAPM